jgi:RNA polymerase sigma-70 factor (ECF subfamily)
MDPEDAALVARLVRERDPDAFHTLYGRHTPMLYALALRLTQSVPDAEDVVHDTWLRAVNVLRTFRGDSALRTWLASVLMNRVRELRRSRVHAPLDDHPEIAQPEPLPSKIDPLDLDRALNAMPDGYREVILLHDVEGFTHEEIGTMLGIEPGTSKSQLSRGRRWLRETLKDA